MGAALSRQPAHRQSRGVTGSGEGAMRTVRRKWKAWAQSGRAALASGRAPCAIAELPLRARPGRLPTGQGFSLRRTRAAARGRTCHDVDCSVTFGHLRIARGDRGAMRLSLDQRASLTIRTVSLSIAGRARVALTCQAVPLNVTIDTRAHVAGRAGKSLFRLGCWWRFRWLVLNR